MSETSSQTSQPTNDGNNNANGQNGTQQTTSTETQSTTPPAPTGTLLNPPEPGKIEAKPEPKKDGEATKTDAKAEGAPEKYADFTTPEGWTMEPAAVADAQALFKDLNLNQAQAQKAVDLYAKYAAESQAKALQTVKDMRAGWVTEAQKTFGKDIEPGGKIVVGLGRVLDSLGDQKLVGEFKQAMDLTGAGDHPAFIGVMAKLLERLGEGTPVNGTKPSPHGQTATGTTGRKTAAQEIYPNLN